MSDYFKTWTDFLDSKKIEGFGTYIIGDLFANRIDKNHPTLPLLAVTGKDGVVLRSSLVKRDTSNQDKSKYLRVQPGDIAYNTMRMWQGVSGLSSYDGIASPAYTICAPNDKISSSFARYLFKLPLLVQVFHKFSQGLVDDTLNLKFINFSSIKVRIPPLPEQQKIAAILTSVDNVIEKTEAQINKLQDLKRGMMQELLTRGIGHTQFKDSPVGRIPVGWDVVGISTLAEKSQNSFVIGPFGSNLVKKDYRQQGVPVVFVRDIKPSRFNWISNIFVTTKKARELIAHSVKPGEIIITKMGLPPGIAAIYNESMPSGVVTADIIRLRPNVKKTSSSFLVEALNSDIIAKQVRDRTAGQTRPKLTLTDYKTILIPLPDLEEQKKIASILSTVDSHIDKKVQKSKQSKSLKKALMQDLLTGKVRVKVD
ncbi:MAG: restriction endonuclease subunit S [Magnetococcales bacterium]|nr:restriction endonuclease subunit S [Magnetococcales bacterium]